MPDLSLINPNNFDALDTIFASDVKQNYQQLIDAVNLLKAQVTNFAQEGVRYVGEVSSANMVVSATGSVGTLTDGTTIVVQVTADISEASLITLKLNSNDPKKVVSEQGVQLRGKDLPNKTLLLVTYQAGVWVALSGLGSRKPFWIAPVPVNSDASSTSIIMDGKLEVPASGGGIIFLPALARTVDLALEKQINGRDYEGPTTTDSTHVLYAVSTEDGLTRGYVWSKNKSATVFFLAVNSTPTQTYTKFALVRQLPLHIIPREDGSLPRFSIPQWGENFAEFEYNRIARGYNIPDIPAENVDPLVETVFQNKLLLRARGPIGYTQASSFRWVPITSDYMTVYAFCLGAGEMYLYNIDEPSPASPGNRLISTAGYSPEHKMRVKITRDPPRFAYRVIAGDWYLQVGGYTTQL